MTIKPGKILISTPSLKDTPFENVVIFVAEYNEKGALGFVINKLFPRKFNELAEFKYSRAFPLFNGGPVCNKQLFFIQHRPDVIDGGMLITDSIYLGGSFEQAVSCIDDSTISENDIKLFIGYCGWDFGELEEEVSEGSWLVSDIITTDIFMSNNNMLWEKCIDQLNK